MTFCPFDNHTDDLEKRAAELLERATGVPVNVEPSSSVAILMEDVIGFARDDEALRKRLRRHGLGQAHEEIRRGRGAHRGYLPAIIVIGEHARVMWLGLQRMSQGGQA